MINITYIYLITGIDNSPYKVYIGKTINPQTRKNHHIQRFGYNIEYNIIDEVHSLLGKDWKYLESYWIEQFRQWGFETINKNEGGGGPIYKTLESRRKQSKSLQGKPKPFNHGINVSLANKGKPKHNIKSKLAISVKNSHPQRIVECPYCNKQGGITAMKHWHFDRYKQRQQ